MKKLVLTVLGLVVLSGMALLQAQDAPEMPEMPKPGPEHQWLERFVGEWESEAEVRMAPDEPPMRYTATETGRMVGGFWAVTESKGEAMDTPFTSILTLGYDPGKGRYIATWVDSMTSHLWQYEGEIRADGNALTLTTEGPCPLSPTGMSKFREVIEFKSPDHKVFTSSRLGEDGEWIPMVEVNSRRK